MDTLPPIVFVTGATTEVGKTVVTAGLIAACRAAGKNVVGLKPLCSGGRDDAEAIFEAQDGVLSLDEINPFSFNEAVAPSLASAREGVKVALGDVVELVKQVRSRRFDAVVVEGAGGLLSPLGDGWDLRDLMGCFPGSGAVVVVEDQLGAIGISRLMSDALKGLAAKVSWLLNSTSTNDSSALENRRLIKRWLNCEAVEELPYISQKAKENELFESFQKKFKKTIAQAFENDSFLPLSIRDEDERQKFNQKFSKAINP